MKTLLTLLTLSTLLLTSCTSFKDKVVPQAKKVASEKLSSAIVKLGQCADEAAVKADIDELLKVEADKSIVVNALSESAPAGVQAQSVVSGICKAAASLALPALLQKGVPAAWKCSLTDLNSKVNELAALACSKL